MSLGTTTTTITGLQALPQRVSGNLSGNVLVMQTGQASDISNHDTDGQR